MQTALVFLFPALVVVVLVIAAFMPSKYNIKKTTIINKPISEVMNVVGNLNYYARWNPWQQMDPTSTKTISGEPNTINHKYSWHGKKLGTGTLTIKNIDDNHIYFDLEFLKPWKRYDHDNWSFEEYGLGETKITWHNFGNLPWPMARLMGPIINKNLNHQFEKGLDNLKKMVEQS
jgi:hypothetical protein